MKEIPSSPSHTQRAHLEALGCVSEMTEDSGVAEWSGHGIRFSLPASMTLTHELAVQALVQQAKAEGKREQLNLIRQVIGITPKL